MSSGLSIKEKEAEDSVEVVISGEVDIYTCQDLKSTLYKYVDKYGKSLVLDCARLTYIDSTGLGVFVAVLKKVRQIDKDITIENLRDSIAKLFTITKLDTLFNIKHKAGE